MSAGGDQNATAGFRFGAVFLISFATVVFLIAAPAANWSRAVALALEFASLLVVIETSRARAATRRARAAVVGVAAATIVILTGAGVLSSTVSFALGAILALVVPAALLGGLWRLFRARGVTVQTVAGALAIYLLVGVLFASVIGFAAHVSDQPYFANGGDGTSSERVYYSFTVLTTTGFGDFTAGTSFARTLAVVEMLLGQLYLVTVIGVLVGNLASRAQRDNS
jgi:hypothetical protein